MYVIYMYIYISILQTLQIIDYVFTEFRAK
jgi:hypothetical protein